MGHDYIADGVVQWGPFQGARQQDLLREEWNCNAIVSQGSDDDDIDALVSEDIDAKGDELWEQGAREVLGDREFERLYPELKRKRREQEN